MTDENKKSNNIQTENINDIIENISKMYELNEKLTSDFEKSLNAKISDRLSSRVIDQMFPRKESEIDRHIMSFLNSDVGKKMGDRIGGVILPKMINSAMNKLSDEQITKCCDVVSMLLFDTDDEKITEESEYIPPETINEVEEIINDNENKSENIKGD